METLKTETLVNTLKLIDGNFTSTHASDLVKELIKAKINFHKINRISLKEANHNDSTSEDNSRIKELEQEIENFRNAILYARENNKNLKLTSLIQIEYTDKQTA